MLKEPFTVGGKPALQSASSPAAPPNDSMNLAQRLSDKAELEMIIIRESMKRVNESLRATRATHINRPSCLRRLASSVRRESVVQEESAALVQTALTSLAEIRENLREHSYLRDQSQLAASIESRIADLDLGLRSRAAAMSAASAAPRDWMKRCRRNYLSRKRAQVKMLDATWKIAAIFAAAVGLSTLLGAVTMSTQVAMLTSGAMFLASALASFAHWKTLQKYQKAGD